MARGIFIVALTFFPSPSQVVAAQQQQGRRQQRRRRWTRRVWNQATSGGGHFGAQGEGWRVSTLTKRELAVHTEDPKFQPLRSHLHRRVEARQALTWGAPTWLARGATRVRALASRPQAAGRRQQSGNLDGRTSRQRRTTHHNSSGTNQVEPRCRKALMRETTGLCQPLPIDLSTYRPRLVQMWCVTKT